MQSPSYELDPRGDVLLTLRQPNLHELVWGTSTSVNPADGQEAGNLFGVFEEPESEPEPGSESTLASSDKSNGTDESEAITFRLSSRHLCLASPIFNAMLCGSWKESAGSVELQLSYDIAATEWNTEALLLLMNIIHGHHRKVPHSVDLDTLAQLSILVDYYECYEIIEFFAHLWIDKLSSKLPTSYGRESVIWLFVSWVFSKDAIFEKMTELALKECEKPLDTMCLPLPPLLLSDIEEKRTLSLYNILSALGELREDLMKGKKGCTFECSSMLLGSLIKEMDKHEINEDQLLESFSDRSIAQFKSTLLGFQKPVWYSNSRSNGYNHYSSHPSYHSCCINSMVEPMIDIVWKNLNGLKLDEYRAQ
ncbi:hypothetical protein GGI43DRAFT_409566 [Trichoderma evansii]